MCARMVVIAFVAAVLQGAETGRVRVVVVDEAGKPLAGAGVHVGDQTTVTDAAGVASLSDLAVGVRSFRFWVPGGIWREGSVAIRGGEEAMLRWQADTRWAVDGPGYMEGDRSPIAFGRLRVVVRDAAGKMATGAQVVVSCGGKEAGRGRTEGDGEAPFLGIPVGACAVTVTMAGFAPWRGLVEVGGTEAAVVAVRLDGKGR